MRRRQATEDTDPDDVIFVLGQPEDNSSGKKKYDRPQRNRCISFILLFGVLANIAVLLVVKIKQRSSRSSTSLITTSLRQSASKTPDDSSVSERGSTSDQPNDSTNTSTNGPDPEPPRIPRRLIFTNKYNLIAPTEKDPQFNAEDPFTANVLRTIEKYQEHWNNTGTELGKDEKVVVSFLSDKTCLDTIFKAEPRLVHAFHHERHGFFKADICRAAELYLNGGYYFDIDIKVVEPINLESLDIPAFIPDPLWNLKDATGDNARRTPGKDDFVTLATVYNYQGRFLMAFTAAMPRHPVLKKSLEYMVAYYEERLKEALPEEIVHTDAFGDRKIPTRRNTEGHSVGPYTLSAAYRATTDEEWEEYIQSIMKEHGYSSKAKKSYEHFTSNRRYARFLYEISLEDEGVTNLGVWKDVPLGDADYTRKRRYCNDVCFGGDKVYFYSRAPGSRVCPVEAILD